MTTKQFPPGYFREIYRNVDKYWTTSYMTVEGINAMVAKQHLVEISEQEAKDKFPKAFTNS